VRRQNLTHARNSVLHETAINTSQCQSVNNKFNGGCGIWFGRNRLEIKPRIEKRATSRRSARQAKNFVVPAPSHNGNHNVCPADLKPVFAIRFACIVLWASSDPDSALLSTFRAGLWSISISTSRSHLLASDTGCGNTNSFSHLDDASYASAKFGQKNFLRAGKNGDECMHSFNKGRSRTA